MTGKTKRPLSILSLITSEERLQAEFTSSDVEITANGLIHFIDSHGKSKSFSLPDLEALIQHARNNIKFDALFLPVFTKTTKTMMVFLMKLNSSFVSMNNLR